MATTEIGERLTEAHRLAQARLGAQVVIELGSAWALMDVTDLDRSALRWAAVASPIIRNRRVQSANLGAAYLRSFRTAELGLAVNDHAPVLSPTVPNEALLSSLRVTGPVKVKQALSRGLSPTDAMALGQAQSSGAGMRHAINGGRDTIIGSLNTDPRALGYMRVTSVKPCGFCVMLSSRGPVYKSEGTASFDPHDDCQCQPVPSYHKDDPWPESAQRNQDIWREAQKSADHDSPFSSAPLNVLRRHLSQL